jgi:hypothetical protein
MRKITYYRRGEEYMRSITAPASALAALLAVLAVSPLRADPVNWAATSNTAVAITGDIVVEDYSITFANGKSLAIEPYEAGRVGDWSGSGKNVAGDVFTADSSSDPKLLNGNKLCATPATYVVIWSPGEGELGLNVYSVFLSNAVANLMGGRHDDWAFV